MQVGPRDRQTAERLFAKLPEPLKKSYTLLTSFLCTMKQFPGANIKPLERNLVKHVILKDVIAPLDRDVQGLEVVEF